MSKYKIVGTQEQSLPYMVDISFLQPVIDAYKSGAFSDKGYGIGVLNALDSLAEYGNVKRTRTVQAFELKKPQSKKGSM